MGFQNILKENPSELFGQLNTFQIRLETFNFTWKGTWVMNKSPVGFFGAKCVLVLLYFTSALDLSDF